MAFLLFGLILWTALGLLRGTPEPLAPAAEAARRRVRRAVQLAFWLTVATMLAGGFVAGIRAGFAYNSFPLMDGRWVPAGYLDLAPAWLNLTENIAAVQFNHRLLASVALLATLWAAGTALRRLPPGPARRAVLLLAGVVALQYGLGILTLLYVVPVSLGTLHQTVAVGVLGAGLLAWHRLRGPPATARAA
jgi:cytochrome c oxidase assembly protein subunit 15